MHRTLAGSGLTLLLLSGLDAGSEVWAQGRRLAAPSDLLAAQTSPTEITLVWQGVFGAQGYVIYGPKALRDLGSSGVQLGNVSAATNRFVAKVVALGREHRYSIQAVGKAKESSARAVFIPVTPVGNVSPTVALAPAPLQVGPGSAAVDSMRPGPPRSFKAALQPPNTIELTWDPVEGATSYQITRRIGPEPPQSIAVIPAQATPFLMDELDARINPAKVSVRYGITTIAATGKSEKITTAVGLGGKNAGNTSASLDKLPQEGGIDTIADTIEALDGSSSPSTFSTAARDLKAELVSPTSVRLTWVPGLADAMYQINRRMGSARPTTITTVAGTVSSFIDYLPAGRVPDTVGYTIESLSGKAFSEEVVVTPTRLQPSGLEIQGMSGEGSTGTRGPLP